MLANIPSQTRTCVQGYEESDLEFDSALQLTLSFGLDQLYFFMFCR